ncbi:hypothetical protein J6590_001615 [Homalodisca vitripennis]|nr:hypothetical protein J6590_001615 [Homalodisca vitripennis]
MQGERLQFDDAHTTTLRNDQLIASTGRVLKVKFYHRLLRNHNITSLSSTRLGPQPLSSQLTGLCGRVFIRLQQQGYDRCYHCRYQLDMGQLAKSSLSSHSKWIVRQISSSQEREGLEGKAQGTFEGSQDLLNEMKPVTFGGVGLPATDIPSISIFPITIKLRRNFAVTPHIVLREKNRASGVEVGGVVTISFVNAGKYRSFVTARIGHQGVGEGGTQGLSCLDKERPFNSARSFHYGRRE